MHVSHVDRKSVLTCQCCEICIQSGLVKPKQCEGVSLEHFAKVQQAYDACMALLAFNFCLHRFLAF